MIRGRIAVLVLGGGLLLWACRGDVVGPPSSHPSHLEFRSYPNVAVAGAPIRPAVRVAVLAANGELLQRETTVTLAASGPRASTAASALRSARTVDGVATFHDIVLEHAGVGQALTATAPSLASVTGPRFTVLAQAAGLAGALPGTESTAAITFDAASSSSVRDATLSWSHIIGGGINRLLVVGVTVRIPNGSQTVLSVQYAGQDLTRAGVERSGPVLVEVWYALESSLPGAGTHAIDVITTGGDVRELDAGAISLAGATQGAPEAVVTNKASLTAGISTTITTLSDNAWVLDAVGVAASGDWTAGAGQVERWDVTAAAATGAGSTLPVPIAGAATVSQTFDVTANRTAHIVLAVAPAPVPVASVVVTPANATLGEGATVQLTAEPRDAAGNPLSGRAISWSSDAPGTATVDSAGLVTGVTPGTAIITATSEGVDGSATITVQSGAIAFDAASQAAARSTTLSWPHPIGGDADRLLVVGTGIRIPNGAETTVSVQYDGVELTRAGAAREGPVLVEVWYLAEVGLPPAGTHAIEITTSGGSVKELDAGAISLSGASQGPPESVGTSTAVNSPQITTGLTMITDSTWVIDVVAAAALGSWTPDAGHTERWDTTVTAATAASSTRMVPAAGPVTVTQTFDATANRSAHVIVAVAPAGPPVPVASVEVTPDNAVILEGGALQVTAQPRDAAGNPLSRTVTWGSSDPSVAAVDGTGLVSGIAAGTATITATSEGVDGTAAITVEPVPVANVAVTPAADTVSEGGMVQLTAQPQDSAGNPLARPVTWSSGDSAVALVDSTGLVTGIAPGTATITATSEGIDGTAAITVAQAPVAAVVVTPPADTALEGASVQFTAQPQDSAGNPLVRPVTWTSTDSAVAVVDFTGLAVGVAAGSATITASSEGIDGTATLVVEAAAIAFDAASSGTDRGTSLTWSHPIGGGADRLLVVGVGVRSPGGGHTVTVRYDGADLTRAGVENNNPVSVELWYLLDGALPAAGTYPVEITTSGGNVREVNAGAISLEGASQAAPEAVATNAADNVTEINTAITVPSDSAWVIDAVVVASSGSWSPGSGQTERWDTTSVAATAAASTRPIVAAGPTTMTQTFHTIANRVAHVVLSVAPAGPPAPVASVDVDPASATITEGADTQLTATPRDAAGNPLARPVTWSTGDPDVATVDGNGLVTGVAAGTVTITATSEGVDGTAAITVEQVPVAAVVMTPAADTVLEGTTTQLTAQPQDSAGNPLARPVTWSSSDSSVATVDSTGLVTGVAVGAATIVATSEGIDGTAAITVAPVPVAAVIVSPAADTVREGNTIQLTAQPQDSAGNPLTRPVSWTSDDPAVASVDANGLVTGQVTGAATIRATSEGVDGTAAVSVAPTTWLFPGDDMQAAVDAHPPGTQFLVKAGIHRLQSVEPKAGNVFTGEPGAIMSGASVLTAFDREGAYWVATGQTQENPRYGPNVYGDEVCEDDRKACIYPEDLYFDDVPLEQVTTLAEVGPGEWYFDYAADKIYFLDDPTGYTVETSVAEFAFRAEFKDGFELHDLVIEKYAAAGQLAAVAAYNSDNVVFDNNEVRLNHGRGLEITSGDNGQILNNFVHHQGQIGIGSYGTTNLLMEGNELADNGYAGYSMFWETGGSKVSNSSGLIVRNNNAHHNIGNGLWTDIDNINALYENNTADDNVRIGIYHEISYDAIIRFNTARNNGEGGITVAHSPNVEVHDNTVTDNAEGILGIQRDRGSGAFGPYEIDSLYVHHNTVTMTAGRTGVLQYVGDDSYFASRGIRFETNTYVLGPNATYFHWLNAWRTAAEWRAFGNDVDGDFTPVPVDTVVVTPATDTVAVGGMVQLVAELRDWQGNPLSRPVSWTTSDSAVASVDTTGLVTGIAAGSVTITATSEGIDGTAAITVEPMAVPVASVVVTPAADTVIEGNTVQLNAEPRDSAGNPLARPVTWASDDTTTATVDTTGLVSGIAAGSATITATSEGVDGTAAITVEPVPVAAVIVTPVADTVAEGGTAQLMAQPQDSAGNPLARPVTWASDDSAVVTVDSTGLVSGVTVGDATIAATSEGVDGTASVTVEPVPVAVVVVTPATVSVFPGAALQLSAEPQDSIGNALSRAVAWTSSDNGVVTVDSTGRITAQAAGTATITATSEGVDGSAAASVTPSQEPGGYAAFAENTLAGLPPAGDETGGPTSGTGIVHGFWTRKAAQDANYAIVTDSTAPASGPEVFRQTYPAGLDGGLAPGKIVGWDSLGSFTQAPKRELYFFQAFKINGPDFEMPTGGIKFGWFGFGQLLGNANGFFFLDNETGQNNGLQDEFRVRFTNQLHNLSYGMNENTDARIYAGQWHQLEAVLELNDIGQDNGVLQVWLDGARILNHANVRYRDECNRFGFQIYRWPATWGGLGGPKTRDDAIDLDHVYLSGVEQPASDLASAVVVTPDSAGIYEGATIQLSAEAQDSAGNPLARCITWASTDTAVATVDSTGLVTGVAAGSAIVTAKADGVVDSAVVVVTPVPVTAVIVTPDSATLLQGATVQLSAEPRDSAGNPLPRPVTWTSGDTTVATVDSTGLVTGLAAGTATITATSEGVDGTASITVEYVPVTAVIVTPAADTVFEQAVIQLTAQPQDSAGNPLARPVTWSSDNPSVAAVDSNGVVTGVTAGSATITATSEGIDGTAAITTMAEPGASLDAVSSSGDRNDSLTWSHTVGGGTDRLLIVGVGIRSPQSGQIVANVRYAGSDLVRAATRTVNAALIEIWYGVEAGLPAAGTHPIAITTSGGTVREIHAGAISLTNANQGPPEAVATSEVSGSAEISTNITTVTDSAWVIDAVIAVDEGSWNAGPDQTERWDSSILAIAAAGSTRPVLTAGPLSVMQTFSATTNRAAQAVIAVGRAAPMTSLDVTPTAPTIQEYTSIQLTAEPRDAAGNLLVRPVTWVSANPAVATVNDSGLVTGVSSDTVTITASAEGIDGTATVTVIPPTPVDSVVVTPDSATVLEGDSQQLTAEPRDSVGNPLVRPVTWSSSDTTVAVVDSTGLVTAVFGGTATITASADGVPGTAAITVQSLVAEVVVTPASAAILESETVQLSAEPRDGEGNPLPRAVTWSTGDSTRATVDATGLVTGIGPGSVAIVANSEGTEGSAVITVQAAVASVEVTPTGDSVDVGSTLPLSATPKDAAGNPLLRPVTWSTQNPGRASVDSTGTVNGIAAGAATITATSEGVDGTAGVTVVSPPPPPPPPPVATVAVSPATLSMGEGTTIQLSAEPRDSVGNPLTGRSVAWTSIDPTVATVDTTGLVTAVASGTVTITGTSEGVDGDATITVEVVPVNAVIVTPSSAPVVEHESVQLDAEPRDAAGNPLPDRFVTWSSDDPGVATVDASGLVTGASVGTAIVTATSDGVAGTATITVQAAPVTTVAIAPAGAILALGGTVQLSGEPRDSLGNALLGRAVTWTTANGGVATVNASGLVTATGVGSTTIDATVEGVTGNAPMTVTAPNGGTLRAFPGAEGFGAYATGGRGGAVLYVTNLNDAGPGSFREAVSTPGPRTVVFNVAGTIELQSDVNITDGNLTIAGQTAPGDGITLRNGTLEVFADNVIVRYLRVRLGDARSNIDAIGIKGTDVILDHCSFSWATDEIMDVSEGADVTVQWSIMSEGLNTGGTEINTRGVRLGGQGDMRVSFHHNLMAHNTRRMPNVAYLGSTPPGTEATLFVDLRNNVRYNWGKISSLKNNNAMQSAVLVNIVDNVFRSGPSTEPSFVAEVARGEPDNTPALVQLHHGGNDIDGNAVTNANFGRIDQLTLLANPIPLSDEYTITPESAGQSYTRVLQRAGANIPNRDPVDDRIVAEVQSGTGSIIGSQTDVGGWPALDPGTPWSDTDLDGMPDDWEAMQGLNPLDPNDRNGDADGNGYTNLEEYLDWLVNG